MLSLIKKPLLILLLLTAVGGGIYYFQKKNGQVLGQQTEIGKYVEENFPAISQAIEKLPFSSKLLGPTVESSESGEPNKNFVKNSINLTSQQLEVLGQNGNKVKDQLTEFISQIKESSQSTPLHEKAFEYGQYMYCQQVIKEYENTVK
ncbi:hypothetical protein KJZ63_03980 [Patescibacteria group bacterium]|nr:hypothetical protein [Patescibacteria group bacterium]